MLLSPFLATLAICLSGQDAATSLPDTGKILSAKSPLNTLRPSEPADPTSDAAGKPPNPSKWSPSRQNRDCNERPEECPPTPYENAFRNLKPKQQPLSGTIGPRFREDAFGLQLGVRDSGSTRGQWVVGIGGARDQSRSRHDSIHLVTTNRSLSPRVGREFWHEGPGRLVLVGSAVLQASWRWNETTIDSTIHVLRSSESFGRYAYVEEHRSRTFTKREMSIDLLFGAGIRLPSSSGAFALFAGIEAGPGWLTSSDQSQDVDFDDLVFLDPAWRLGMDWCF